MASSKIVKAAAGRSAILGDLYNAHRDEFLSINAFKELPKAEEIFEYENNSAAFHCIETNSIREEFEKLGIDEELSLSIVCGLANVGDFAPYLKEQTNSVNSRQMTLVYTLFTKTEEVDGILKMVNVEYLHGNEATHIVVGINWGAQCTIVFRHDGDGRIDEEQVKKKVIAEMDKLKAALSCESISMVDGCEQSEEDNIKRFYHTSCSIGNFRINVPQSFEDVLNVAKSVPDIIAQFNNGKGVPIKYILLPLNSLRKLCKIDIRQDAIDRPTDKHTVNMCFDFMQGVRESRQKINGVLQEFGTCKEGVASRELKDTDELQTKFYDHVERCKSELCKALVARRLGEDYRTSITNMVQEFHKGAFSPTDINNTLNSHDYTLKKIKFINECKRKGVLYIGKTGNINNALHQNMKKTVFVFYMDYGKQSTRVEEWQEHKELFFKLIAAYNCNEKVQLIVADLDFQTKLATEQGMCTKHYDHGNLICKDLVKEEGQDLSKCLIEIDAFEQLTKKPSKRVPFQVHCPSSFKGRCDVEDCQWICKKCREVVEYGIHGEFLYCKCGKSSVFDATFRCSSAKHGLSFIAFTHSDLQAQISSLSAVKETNILLLGETGVGKSTWINAIANYFAFGSLQEAIDARDMKVLIPSNFDHASGRDFPQIISVGPKSANENMVLGQHCTLRPKEYMFHSRNHTLCFIDTPGICDDRGPEQDKENLESILDFLAYYDKIHAICIMLKPQESRLSQSFRFSVVELISYLHNSASDNIVFCFTHSRNTHYKPSTTTTTLQALFEEYDSIKRSISLQKQFYFENEAFRFLACYQHGFEFSASNIDEFSESWDKSVSDTLSLLKYIKSIKPHSIQDTISLNRARQIIIELGKPIVEIADNLQVKLASTDAKCAILESSPKTDAELKEILWFDDVELEFIKLDYPRTVCTHHECAVYVTNDRGTETAIHMKICHEPCTLTSISPEVTNDRSIRWCRAFYIQAFKQPIFPYGSLCNICQHSWEDHCHITYDIKEKVERVKDVFIHNIMDKELSYPERVAAIIDKLQKRANEMRKEKHEITMIGAQMGCFLKKHAITPFNDNIDEYLTRLIQVEEKKEKRDGKKIKRFKDLRRSYDKRKQLIQDAMDKKEQSNVKVISSPNEVIRLSEKLCEFKYTGRYFKEFKKAKERPYQRNEACSLCVSSFKSQLSHYLSKEDTGASNARENEDC